MGEGRETVGERKKEERGQEREGRGDKEREGERERERKESAENVFWSFLKQQNTGCLLKGLRAQCGELLSVTSPLMAHITLFIINTSFLHKL